MAEDQGVKIFDMFHAPGPDAGQFMQRIDCGVYSAIFILDNTMEMK